MSDLNVLPPHSVPDVIAHVATPHEGRGQGADLARVVPRLQIRVLHITQSELDHYVNVAKHASDAQSAFFFAIGSALSALGSWAAMPPLAGNHTFTYWDLVVPTTMVSGLILTVFFAFRWRRDAVVSKRLQRELKETLDSEANSQVSQNGITNDIVASSERAIDKPRTSEISTDESGFWRRLMKAVTGSSQ